MAGVWNNLIFKIPSNPDQSVILWYRIHTFSRDRFSFVLFYTQEKSVPVKRILIGGHFCFLTLKLFSFNLSTLTVIKYFVSNNSAFIYILSDSFFVVLFDKD